MGDKRSDFVFVFTDVEEIVESTFDCAIRFVLEKTFHNAAEDQ